jgi:hypothetical protein
VHNFASALSLITIAIVSYYAGIYIRHYYFPNLSHDAISSIRFATLPLILVMSVVMSSQLGAAREGFLNKQRTIDDMASLSVQLDRALTYYGKPAEQAQADFRDYLRYILSTPDAMWGGVDRTNAEKFAIELQTLPVPIKDPGIAANTKKFILDLMGRISLDRYKLATLSIHGTYAFTSLLLSLWLSTIFICIGVSSEPLSSVAFFASLAVAFCVGSTAFITNEFENARQGLIQVSIEPFGRVLKEIGEK